MRTASRLAALLLCFAHLPVSGQQPAPWRLVPELRIGSVDAPNYSLTRIRDIEVDARGRMFVGQLSEIDVFDDEGRFLYTFGRAGGGPGEFRRIDDLLLSPSGLLVMDEPQTRLSLFSLDGRFLDSWGPVPQRLEPHLLPAPPRALLTDGTVVVVPSYNVRKDAPVAEVPLIASDTAGSHARVLATLNVRHQTREGLGGDLRALMVQPVNSSTLWAFPRDMNGIILVHRRAGDADNQGEIDIVHLTSTGDTVMSKRYRIPIVEIPASVVRDSLERKIRHWIKRTQLSRDRIEAVITDGWRVPPYQAPVDRLIAGVDGTIWLRRGAFGLDVATWWVLDGRGNILATLRVPASLRVHRVSADRVWATEKGEYDVPYVVRMRVVKP